MNLAFTTFIWYPLVLVLKSWWIFNPVIHFTPLSRPLSYPLRVTSFPGWRVLAYLVLSDIEAIPHHCASMLLFSELFTILVPVSFFRDEEARTWQLRCGHIIDLHACISLFPSNSQYFICFLDLLWALKPHEESVINPKIALQVVMVGSKAIILYMKVCLLCVFPHASFHVYLHLNFICYFITSWLQILFLLFSQPSSLLLWIS